MNTTIKPWNEKEQRKLKFLRIDPVKSDRNRLVLLLRHFKGTVSGKPGGIWAVTEGDRGPVRISRGLAIKIRNLVNAGDLDWVENGLHEENESVQSGPYATPPIVANASDCGEPNIIYERHIQSLLYFGKSIRDRIYLDSPLRFAENLDLPELPLWEKPELVASENDEAEEVEKGWGDSLYDAQTHSFFSPFQQHIHRHMCWQILKKLKTEYSFYQDVCRESFAQIQEKLEPVSKRMDEQGLRLMATRIFMFARAAPLFDELSIGEDAVVGSDGMIRHPVIKHRIKKRNMIDYNLDLAGVERQVVNAVAHTINFQGMSAFEVSFTKTIQEFQKSLGSDDELKQRLLSSKCQWCLVR